MALTKPAIVERMADELGLHQKQSTAAVESLLEIIETTLAAATLKEIQAKFLIFSRGCVVL